MENIHGTENETWMGWENIPSLSLTWLHFGVPIFTETQILPQ
jgi:hypothetical protein